MRLSGKRAIKTKTLSRVSSRQESRDGILWDILPDSRVCRVKIQGSNTYVMAHYPQHWATQPEWLKPRMSVRIAHVEGDRGKIEVVGQGRSIPTPVSGDALPDVETGDDGLVSNCEVVACKDSRMAVLVHTGSFRISGTTYTLTPITMAGGSNYYLDDGGMMGEIAAAVSINAAPSSGLFRYDLISVGSDLVIDYIVGTPASSPTRPSLASSHVALAYILVPSGVTEITDIHIQHEYTEPTPSRIVMTITDKDIEWTDPVTTNVKLEIFDQYDNSYSVSAYFSLEIAEGNGTVWSENSGPSTTSVNQTATGSYTFTYTRDKIEPGDESPVLLGTAVIESLDLIIYDFIRLYDSSGNYMSA